MLGDGSIALVEIARGTVSRVALDGTVSVIAELGGGPNGGDRSGRRPLRLQQRRVLLARDAGMLRPTGTPEDIPAGG